MPIENHKHIKFEGFSKTERYTSPATGGESLEVATRNRNQHGNFIKSQLLQLKTVYEDLQSIDLPSGIIREDAIYVEFISEFNLELAFDSLDNYKNIFVLLSTKKIVTEINGEITERYKAVVMLTMGGISAFLKKVEDYLTKTYLQTRKPHNLKLINNIQEIRLATLQSFWLESSDALFPEINKSIWWEVWLRRQKYDSDLFEDSKVIAQLEGVNATISDRRILFPEHIIRLVRATPKQLSDSLLLLDNLAELRIPQEISEFFTKISNPEQESWVEDLIKRIVNKTERDSVAICLLDTGINNGHVLLNQFAPNENLDSIEPTWGTYDSAPHGHGTQMAGLALYGDLSPLLTASENIYIFHQLESIKLINKSQPHDPDLYGKVTEEAVARAITNSANRLRVFCMAITCYDTALKGRPSSWSASVDRIVFDERSRYLFFISSGNVFVDEPNSYPDKNDVSSIEDPGQSFNAITVGSYTEKDLLDPTQYPGMNPLVSKGGMCHSNPTSLIWENQWPIKPDIVLEGGNIAFDKDGSINDNIESLQLLTTNNDLNAKLFCLFGDSSASTALASRFSAQILSFYPQFWPETIRGLIIHSADWNKVMRGNKPLTRMTVREKINMLKRFGYGVPNIDKALYSANNALTLIAERSLTPYQLFKGKVKTKEMHVYELPWPKDILEKLAEADARLIITLSYFIDPNPGNREYASKYHYQSHALRFKLNGPQETLEAFRRRVNKEAQSEESEATQSSVSENWLLGNCRNKGSIHKDIWEGSAADLSAKNLIAIYPINGWYRIRKKLMKYDSKIRYSLIVSIETPNIDVNIYTPVLNQITQQIPVRLRT